jgi:hypothetical protein
MIYLDNRAGRLHDVLTQMAAQAGAGNLRIAWTNVLKPDPNTPALLMECIAQVMRLALDAEADVRGLEDEDGEMLLAWVPAVTSAMGQAHLLDTNVASVNGPVGPTGFQALEYAARELHRRAPRPQMAETKRDEALELVAALLATLQDSDELDPASRAMLIRHAAALQYALNLAWVTGPEGVDDALAGAWGAASIVLWTNPENGTKTTFNKFVEAMKTLSAMLLLAQTGLAIGTSVAGLLGS